MQESTYTYDSKSELKITGTALIQKRLNQALFNERRNSITIPDNEKSGLFFSGSDTKTEGVTHENTTR